MRSLDGKKRYCSPERNQISARVLDELDANVVVLNHAGEIIFANQSWDDFAANNPLTDGSPPVNVAVGTNYLDVCKNATGRSSENSASVHEGILAVLCGKKKIFSHEYPCHSPTKQRWFQMRAKVLKHSRPRQIAIFHFDITDRRLAEMESEAKQKELSLALADLQQMAARIKDSIGSSSTLPMDPLHSQDTPPSWKASDRIALLSKREHEVMMALVRGERNSAIADRLNISIKSVSTYRYRVLEKLKVETNADLVTLMYAEKIAETNTED